MKKNRTEFRVIYRDTDAEGVVYYANYLAWFEAGRSELIRALGISLPELKKKENIVFAIKDVFCEYLRPARYDDEIVVETEISEVMPVRIVFEQQIRRKVSSELLTKAKVTAFPIDLKTFRPVPIPKELKEKLKA
ncbi:MAG TPA: YbgC/FadM family acyl-CoA thioesterase [Candidatus Omnitrophota bacterium]|nr:YbgC/FadM family acyl-CoA thioesterase [Candidatus Omnitrophota bacterium]